MSEAGCPCCGCRAAGGLRAHAIAAALRDDDLDQAMTLGLLDGGDAFVEWSVVAVRKMVWAELHEIRRKAAEVRPGGLGKCAEKPRLS